MRTLLEVYGSATKIAEAKEWPYRSVARWVKDMREGRSRAVVAVQPDPEPDPVDLPDLADPSEVRGFLLETYARTAAGGGRDAIAAARALGQLTGADQVVLVEAEDGSGLSPQDARHIRAVRRRMAIWYRAAVMRQLERREAATGDERVRLDRLHELYFAAANARTGSEARMLLAEHLRAWGDDLFR